MSVGGEKSGQRWPLWGVTFNEKSEPSEVMDRVFQKTGSISLGGKFKCVMLSPELRAE